MSGLPGRPRKLGPPQMRYLYRARARRVPMRIIARTLGCARSTLYLSMRYWPAQ